MSADPPSETEPPAPSGPPNYTGLEAELYDDFYQAETMDDLEFWQWLLPDPEEEDSEDALILEAGCGTGRLLLPLAQSGLRVVGADNSAAMLTLCREKLENHGLKAPLYEQPLEELKVDERFEYVISPAFTFQMLTGRDAASAALRAFHTHLLPGGHLALSLFIPWAELERPSGEEAHWALAKHATRPRDGALLLCHQAATLDRHAQLMTQWNRYEVHDASGQLIQTATFPMDLRWYHPHEMKLLLQAHGFEPLQAFGDFSPEPAQDGHATITYVARRKA